MADVTHGKFVFKDSSNNAGTVLGLSANDISKMNAKATLDVVSSASASISNKHGELFPATDRLTAPDTHYPVVIQAHFVTGDIKQTMNPNFDATEWVLGNGALVPRTGAYKDLWEFANDLGLVRDASAQASYESNPSTFEGLSYGPGDGSTTFQLPDFRGRVIQGADASHALGHFIKAGLPNITGQTGSWVRYRSITTSGAIYKSADQTQQGQGLADPSSGFIVYSGLVLDASGSNSTYGNSNTVQPLAVSSYNLIKL